MKKKSLFLGMLAMGLALTVVLAGCGRKEYKIGEKGPAGGIVFFDKMNDIDGWRYLEASPQDLGETQWGSNRQEVGGTETGIGSGKENTRLIVAKLQSLGETGCAAQLCAAYKQGGKGDWFLPSMDELDLMYQNLKKTGLANFNESRAYWTSSEDGNEAWLQEFSNGRNGRQILNGGGYFGYSKDRAFSVRAVRAF
jgi:hypothetical protein